MLKDLITTADAGKILDVVPDTVRHLARTGRLPVAVLTPSGQRLFTRRDVEQLATAREQSRSDRLAGICGAQCLEK